MKKRRTFNAFRRPLSNGLLVEIDGNYDPEVPFDDLNYDVDFQCPECEKFLTELEYDHFSEAIKQEIHVIAEDHLKQQLIADEYRDWN